MAHEALRLLFAGQNWLGSCARSLREALSRQVDLCVEEVNEDGWFTAPRRPWLRAVNRLTHQGFVREFEREVKAKARMFRPDLFLTYKGMSVSPRLLSDLRSDGVFTVNVYPDCSPHAHGAIHKLAVADYDLVISTKIYHPPHWSDVYGYHNDCLFVPQGYDPALHLFEDNIDNPEYDLVMVATYRPEYGRLVRDLAALLPDPDIKVAIGGNGWAAAQPELPGHWVFPGGVGGRSYVSLLRQGRICVAPLTREMVVDGKMQPGDVDSTRSYELAAAHCFFIHRRTDYAMQLYGPDEVPMFDDAAELAGLIRHYLKDDAARARMAAAAHRRAVPAYSLDARAAEIVNLLRPRIAARKRGRP